MKVLPTEVRTYEVFFVIILKYFLEAQILNIHDLNTNLNYLSSNVLSLYCVFLRSKFSFVFNSMLTNLCEFNQML